MNRHRLIMLFSFVLIISIVASAGKHETLPPKRKIYHLGYSDYDRLLECLQTHFGKPAIREELLPGDFRFPACTSTSKELEEILSSNDLKFIDSEWIFLALRTHFADDALPPLPKKRDEFTHYIFKKVRVDSRSQSFDEDMTSVEIERVTTTIVRDARLIPVIEPDEIDGDEGVIKIKIGLHKLQPGPDRPIVIAAFISQAKTDRGRLVYGELRGQEYTVIWDSPLLNSHRGYIEFADLDGDGKDEIIVEGETAGNHAYPMLSIFSSDGRELTRQKARCGTYNERDSTCPIICDSYSFEQGKSGSKNLIVRGWEYSNKTVTKFEFQAGHFHPVQAEPVRAVSKGH